MRLCAREEEVSFVVVNMGRLLEAKVVILGHLALGHWFCRCTGRLEILATLHEVLIIGAGNALPRIEYWVL